MKRLNDLIQERSKKLNLMKQLVANCIREERGRNINEENTYNNIDTEVRNLDEEISLLQAEDEMNKRSATWIPVNGISKNLTTSFRDHVNKFITGETKEHFNVELRADPILTTTDTNIINKTVAGVDIMFSPAEKLLRDLGVKFYTGVTGNLVLPDMTEDTATFPGEDVSALSANMATTSITLSALKATHTQTISRETLTQTNPDLLTGVIQNLTGGIWNAVATKFFDDIDIDASTQLCGNGNSAVTFNHIVNLEASVAYDLMRPAYVMKPQTKAYLKKTTKLANAQNSIWENNTVNEYPAFSSPFCNDERIYFGDWAKTVVAIFGNGIEIIVDPFTKAKQGEIVLTAIGMFDCGVRNKRAFSILADASTF